MTLVASCPHGAPIGGVCFQCPAGEAQSWGPPLSAMVHAAGGPFSNDRQQRGQVAALQQQLQRCQARETCMCGEPMEGHSSASGHTPLSMHDHVLAETEMRLAKVEQLLAERRAADQRARETWLAEDGDPSYKFEDHAHEDMVIWLLSELVDRDGVIAALKRSGAPKEIAVAGADGDDTRRLPEPRRLVLALLEGASYHLGYNIGFVRSGWAFMVRWENAPSETVADGWSLRHYNDALKQIDADYANVKRWIYIDDIVGISVQVEEGRHG